MFQSVSNFSCGKALTRPGLLALLDVLLPTLSSLSLLFGNCPNIVFHSYFYVIAFISGATVLTVEEAGGPRIAVILAVILNNGALSQEHNMVSNIYISHANI